MRPSGQRRLFWTLVLIGGVGCLIFWAMHQSPTLPAPATVLPETHRTNLVLEANHWYLPDKTNSFTGLLLDTYEDGGRKSLTMVSNGLLHGLSMGWHTNGLQQVEEHFVVGTSHGARIKWHPNGQKFSEANVVKGKLHGIFRRWDEQGALSEEIEMKNGQPDGISRSYYPSGSLKVEARLKQGQVIENQQWKDGEKALLTQERDTHSPFRSGAKSK